MSETVRARILNVLRWLVALPRAISAELGGDRARPDDPEADPDELNSRDSDPGWL